MLTHKAVLLDRDGVINPDVGHPNRIEDAVLFPDVAPALLRLQSAGYILAIVSNQSGVARGYFGMQEVVDFNRVISAALNAVGVSIRTERFFVCPHGPADECGCRKPKPGLINRAARELKLDLRRSFLVGDAESDIAAGRAAGVLTILLNRGRQAASTGADWTAHGMSDVADFVQHQDMVESSELLFR